MKVYFVGAGPGAADLITVRGARILSGVPVVLYAGSLVPREIVTEYARADAELVDTRELNLEEQEEWYRRAREEGWDVARVHSGDPSIYGAMAEQMRRLDTLGIEYEVVPGVSSFTASAAAIGAELTKPEISQTVILTRVSGRASPVPEREAIAKLGVHGATMCVFLSGPQLPQIVADLLPHYGPETPVALVRRATWPDERVHRSTLGRVLEEVKVSQWKLTTILLVGEVLGEEVPVESRLYAAEYAHRFRKAKKRPEAV
jgi:precorrin-4/cobalt-precorrin-4 C11-methyltransferase